MLEKPLESVDPDDLVREPTLFEHAAVVPIIEQADIDNENPAMTIVVTIAERCGTLWRRTAATSLVARPPVDCTGLLTVPPPEQHHLISGRRRRITHGNRGLPYTALIDRRTRKRRYRPRFDSRSGLLGFTKFRTAHPYVRRDIHDAEEHHRRHG